MTGRHLRVRKFSDKVMGVVLEGNPSKPEPEHFRVRFPGGDVDLARTSDGKYWAHVRVNNPRSTGFDPFDKVGAFEESRADYADRDVKQGVDVGIDLYHVAMKVGIVADEEDRSQYEISRQRADPRCEEPACHVRASRCRPDGFLTCGNHDDDRETTKVCVNDCTFVVTGSSVVVRDQVGGVLLHLQLGTGFEMERSNLGDGRPMIEVKAETGSGLYRQG